MQITIHRGIDQIGGCITEISTADTRIFIDMGDNLPGNGEPLSEEEKTQLVGDLFQHNKRQYEAVFFTHSHSDHVGMLHLIPRSIPLYMSQGTYDVLHIKQEIGLKMKEYGSTVSDNHSVSSDPAMMIERLDACSTWQRHTPGLIPSPITIGNIKVTPYFVSHSSYDSSMLLIEAEGKKILHTGDYRGHGYLSGELLPTLEEHIGQVDYLITEGTMLAKKDINETESVISDRMYDVMGSFKYVFVLVSSTDVERLAAVDSATKRRMRMLVSCSLTYNRMLEYFKDKTNLVDRGICDFNFYKYSLSKESTKLISKMRREGFSMLVGPQYGERVQQIRSHFDPAQTLLIYSSWDGYYKIPEQVALNPAYKEFRELFSYVIDLHTSGHADAATITKVIKAVSPREGIIGIHKPENTSLTSLDLPDSLKAKIIPENTQPDCVTIQYKLRGER
jgi:ribonuclease J